MVAKPRPVRRATCRTLSRRRHRHCTLRWDELRRNGDTRTPTRPHYIYSSEASETSFKTSATYSGPDPKAPWAYTVVSGDA